MDRFRAEFGRDAVLIAVLASCAMGMLGLSLAGIVSVLVSP
jgi:hypothetical protein